MKTNLLVGVAATFTVLGVGLGFAACGGSSATQSNGADATADGAGTIVGDGGLSPDVFGPDGATGTCSKLGAACATGVDCCSGSCTNGVCDYPQCTSDNGACTVNGDCCSQQCTSGTCKALNTTCKTLGNQCTGNTQCCSGLCAGGTCQPSSFCGQGGDSCYTNIDCCTGTCTIASGQTLGTCAASAPSGPANCGMVDGQLCGGGGTGGTVTTFDGGVPPCGGPCCSRSCAPWGPTGVLVCQPASGCHPTGDLCQKDSDCCGSAGLPYGGPKPVTCDNGICRLATGCQPNGDVCKLQTTSCNSRCDCCSGNCETMDTCKQDNVGVPRCASPQCVNPGSSCASSADCCNGAPCVPNPGGNPPYVCYQSACVPSCGSCTNNADCCPGESCVMAAGSTQGTCGPCGGPTGDGGTTTGDGGTTGLDGGGTSGGDAGCALYGQICTTSAECCNGVPCTNGRCQAPVF